jgi:hypothetical protein
MSKPEATSNKPAAEIQRGWIKAAIWRRVNKDNVAVYSVSITRSYRDDSGAYASSNSYSGDELLVVAEIARAAWNHVHKLRRLDWEAKRKEKGSAGSTSEPGIDEDVPF